MFSGDLDLLEFLNTAASLDLGTTNHNIFSFFHRVPAASVFYAVSCTVCVVYTVVQDFAATEKLNLQIYCSIHLHSSIDLFTRIECFFHNLEQICLLNKLLLANRRMRTRYCRHHRTVYSTCIAKSRHTYRLAEYSSCFCGRTRCAHFYST